MNASPSQFYCLLQTVADFLKIRLINFYCTTKAKEFDICFIGISLLVPMYNVHFKRVCKKALKKSFIHALCTINIIVLLLMIDGGNAMFRLRKI